MGIRGGASKKTYKSADLRNMALDDLLDAIAYVKMGMDNASMPLHRAAYVNSLVRVYERIAKIMGWDKETLGFEDETGTAQQIQRALDTLIAQRNQVGPRGEEEPPV